MESSHKGGNTFALLIVIAKNRISCDEMNDFFYERETRPSRLTRAPSGSSRECMTDRQTERQTDRQIVRIRK